MSVTTRTVGRVTLLTAKPVMALVSALLFADLLGTMGWVSERITDAPVLFHMFGFAVSWWSIGMTLVFFMFTTGIQMVTAAIAIRANTNVVMASAGFYFWLFSSVMNQTTLKYTDPSYAAPFIDAYGRVEKMWGGLSFLCALYIPSQIFDTLTDANFYATTPLRAFSAFFGAASMISEHLAYMSAAALTMAEDAQMEMAAAGGGGQRGGGGGQRPGGGGQPKGGGQPG